MAKSSADLLYGTLNVLVLKALARQPMHGYGLSNQLRDWSDGALAIDDAALYKALYRLEDQGAVGSEWGITDNNRRAKYYHITAAGRKQLRLERQAWDAHSAMITRILRIA